MLSPMAHHRFGATVRQYRVQEGLSHADLADLLDLPPTLDLAALEAGDGIGALDLGIAMDLADFCGLTMAKMASPVKTRKYGTCSNAIKLSLRALIN